ncbi:nicotinamide riboside transporter PnuC [Pedobacter montanisoli]|uniref:Nicotinamide riboside transporter PnuC n=1 Tax=Pedobacter montanisoli TaxID=2923277 RepID=A0ABS9ZVT1_9SPHI|nr:nicotinamide riboside transporter PnuC [Pedobacter montanisoli]MCJ0742416.1 nicotinamide riboside transporter PnuC [Pedobacter montanisoli]
MEFQEWFSLFKEQVLATSFLEWFAVIFGVAEVLLARKNNILLYPAGIISVVLSMYLLVHTMLYAEALLNLYYLVMSIYGWAVWQRNNQEGKTLAVSWTNRSEMLRACSIVVGGYILLYTILVKFTKSDVPAFDAFVSSAAWAGMWLLARRKIENWVFLNVSNIVAIPLLIHKGLLMMALLTAFLFVVAIFGFIDWKRIYKAQY